MKTTALITCFSWMCAMVLSFSSLSGQALQVKMTADDLFEKYGESAQAQSPDVDRQRQQIPQPFPVSDGVLKTNACASAFIMNTPYNSNNGQRGCMFNVTAANAVTIRCFESNVYAGTTANYEIYYRAGTHVGFENNAAAWNFIGGATGVTSAGNNLPTALPIPVNVTIPAGQTYSFYITNDFGGGTSYTDGTAVGNFLASDANITVFEGVGKSYPFGLTFNVRNFNGHIFYDLAGVLDANETTLEGHLTEQGPELNWSLEEGAEFSTVKLEKSLDGTAFAPQAQLDVDVEGTFLDTEQTVSEAVYYRLQMRTLDGQYKYSNVVEVKLGPTELEKIAVAYPNPFQERLTIELVPGMAGNLQLEIADRLGRVVAQKELIEVQNQQKILVNLDHLPAGIYVARLQSESAQQMIPLIKN